MRTEAKTKNAHESLTLTENNATPEPSTIALLVIGGGIIAFHF